METNSRTARKSTPGTNDSTQSGTPEQRRGNRRFFFDCGERVARGQPLTTRAIEGARTIATACAILPSIQDAMTGTMVPEKTELAKTVNDSTQSLLTSAGRFSSLRGVSQPLTQGRTSRSNQRALARPRPRIWLHLKAPLTASASTSAATRRPPQDDARTSVAYRRIFQSIGEPQISPLRRHACTTRQVVAFYRKIRIPDNSVLFRSQNTTSIP
jgi:hypothetical protein